MELLRGWAGLILGFSGLIFVHELGHFLLAKWNGVRVHVFSIGMGPYLISFTYNGTVYALSLVPVGGYVRMLGQDDLNADLSENKNPADFRNKRPGQKAAILVAGAVFNIVLTLLIYTGCYWVGMFVSPPCIGHITPETPLARAVMYADPAKPADLQKGDRIVRVNDVPVKSYIDLMMQVTACPNGEPIVLAVKRAKDSFGGLEYVRVETERDKKQGVSNIGFGPHTNYEKEEPLALGFTAEVYIAFDGNSSKSKDSAAVATGKFKAGDHIVQIEDLTDPAHPVVTKMDSRSALYDVAATSKGKEVTFVVEHIGADGKAETERIPVTPKFSDDDGGYRFGILPDIFKRVTKIDPNSDAYKAGLRDGFLVLGFSPENANIHPWKTGKLLWKKTADEKKPTETPLTVSDIAKSDDKLIYKQEYPVKEFFQSASFFDAVGQSCSDTRYYTGCIFSTLRNLFTGSVSAKNLSGPLGIGGSIFTVASEQTFPEYMWWLAFISLNLGVFQLLPIPLLDGFHLLMVLVEKIKGSAVSAKIQEKFMYAGLLIVGSLFVYVMFNDVKRLWFG